LEINPPVLTDIEVVSAVEFYIVNLEFTLIRPTKLRRDDKGRRNIDRK